MTQPVLSMNFFPDTERAIALREQLTRFMAEHIYPNESQVWKEAHAQRWDSPEGWTVCPTVERLKKIAHEQGFFHRRGWDGVGFNKKGTN